MGTIKFQYISKYQSLAIFFISLFVYFATLCPTVYVGDSGELTAAAYSLGIPHPSGYPLYCVLGKIFTLLFPFGDIGFRVNLLSAFFASVSIVFLYLILIKITNDSLLASAASLAFAFSKTLWSQSVFAEVYTLNIFFIAVLFYLFLVIKEKYDKNILHWNTFYLSAFIFGISLTNHHTMLLFTPIYLAFIIYIRTPIKKLLITFALIILGLSFYCYIPIRSLANPYVNWGNPETFNNFIHHITRSQYGSLTKEIRTFSLFLNQIKSYYNSVFIQYTPYLLILIPFGIVYFRKQKLLLYFTLALFFIFSFGFIYLLNSKLTPEILDSIEVFSIPSYFILAILIGSGSKFIIEQFKSNLVKILLATFIILLPLKQNFPVCNQNNNFIAYDLGKNIFKSMLPKSTLLSSGDNHVFSLVYLRTIEETNKDIKIYDDSGNLFPTTNINLISEPSVYYTIFSKWGNSFEAKAIEIAPNGIIYKLGKYSEKESKKIWESYNLRGYIKEKDFLSRIVIVQYYFFLGEKFFAEKNPQKALYEYNLASEIGFDMEKLHYNIGYSLYKKNMWNLAKNYFKKAIDVDWTYTQAHNNLSVIYLTENDFENATKEVELAIKFNPNNAEAYNNLGTILGRKGDLKNAITAWKKALHLNSNITTARENIERAKSMLESKTP
ncbi:MAG: DUF2723 domain-containing protein [Candidatus Firestonebacteria bacterium]